MRGEADTCESARPSTPLDAVTIVGAIVGPNRYVDDRPKGEHGLGRKMDIWPWQSRGVLRDIGTWEFAQASSR
jgi:hypothetical protein